MAGGARGYNAPVRAALRFAAAFLVLTIVLPLAGLPDLCTDEPGGCAPACSACFCCRSGPSILRAPAELMPADTSESWAGGAPSSGPSSTDPRDVFHVPK